MGRCTQAAVLTWHRMGADEPGQKPPNTERPDAGPLAFVTSNPVRETISGDEVAAIKARCRRIQARTASGPGRMVLIDKPHA